MERLKKIGLNRYNSEWAFNAWFSICRLCVILHYCKKNTANDCLRICRDSMTNGSRLFADTVIQEGYFNKVGIIK